MIPGIIKDNMKKIDYKVDGGKLLRIELLQESGIIKKIKIKGDFFIYPEEAIFLIEDFLIGKKIDEFSSLLDDFLRENKIEVIGFAPLDLEVAIGGS